MHGRIIISPDDISSWYIERHVMLVQLDVLITRFSLIKIKIDMVPTRHQFNLMHRTKYIARSLTANLIQKGCFCEPSRLFTSTQDYAITCFINFTTNDFLSIHLKILVPWTIVKHFEILITKKYYVRISARHYKNPKCTSLFLWTKPQD